MTSPRKSIDHQKDSTIFGELQKVETMVKKMTARLSSEMVVLKNLNGQYHAVEKQARHSTEQSRTKLMIEVKIFQQKVKNHTTIQKAEFMRCSNQIEAMNLTSKQVNANLTLLSSKLKTFTSNVGL